MPTTLPLSQVADWIDPEPIKLPHTWIREDLGEHVWTKQQEICESIIEHRFTTVRSAHGTGKSFIASRIATWWLDQHPIGEAFVVTSAPTDKQVKAILWREIGRAHRRGDLVGRINLDAEWYIGQEMVAFGRKPADYSDADQARQAFQGIHAKYVLVVLDEACGIPKWLWEATDTLVTNDHSRVLAIGNPDDPSTEFEKTHRPNSGWNRIRISAFDLPCYTGERIPSGLEDVLTGRTWVEERKKKWGESSNLYTSKVLGEFPEISDDTLITPAMMRTAVELDLSGEAVAPGQMGADIARLGTDETVCYHNRGGRVRLVYRGSKKDTMTTAGALYNLLDRHHNTVPMNVDIIGLGAGVFDRLREQGMRAHPFNASQRAYRPDKFVNRRAEAFWFLRNQFEMGMVDVDPEDEDLQAQLCDIKFRYDSRGRVVIESKDDMKKRGLTSPDRADAVAMAFQKAIEVYIPDDDELEDGLTDDLLDRPM